MKLQIKQNIYSYAERVLYILTRGFFVLVKINSYMNYKDEHIKIIFFGYNGYKN